jgi:hypothetical protein
VGDEGDSGKLLSVKALGSELELGAGLPKALAMVFPGSAAKRHARLVLAGTIIEKARDGQALDDAELDYATEVLSAAEAKFIRQRQIKARALAAYQSQEAKQLPAPAGEPAPDAAKGSAKATPDDWVNKFWDDAGLVDDETLQEIYARVLASEARAPGTCSLRTLAVLRYLDREAAEAFSKVVPLVFEREWLPNHLPLLPRFGVSYSVITSVVEAGLMLPTNSNIVKNLGGSPTFFRFGRRVLSVEHDARAASFQIITLTKAGKELYRVAEVPGRADYFIEAAGWLKKRCHASAVLWAEMPSPDWEGPDNLLNWQSIDG